MGIGAPQDIGRFRVICEIRGSNPILRDAPMGIGAPQEIGLFRVIREICG